MAINSTMKFEPVATLNAMPVSSLSQYKSSINPTREPPGRKLPAEISINMSSVGKNSSPGGGIGSYQ